MINFIENKWLKRYAADRQLIKRPKNHRAMAVIILAVVVTLGIILAPAAYSGFAVYKSIKSLDATAGQLLANASKQDLSAISANLAAVEGDLSDIRIQAKKLGLILLLPPVKKSANTADRMLSAAIDLIGGYREILNAFSSLSASVAEGRLEADFSTVEGRRAILKSIADNQDALDKAKAKIKSARAELSAISSDDLSGIFKSKIVQANGALSEMIGQSEAALPLLKYLPEIAGYGAEKNYLLLFQNNMELRPTGGFIGSYGIVTVKDGEIIRLYTDDIYNLDKLSKDKLLVPAPWPMTAYNNQKYLFLRDANWSPDWPTSARQIDWFWNAERANAGLPPVNLDGIVAITPDFIANFLALTGPITADGITFNHDNFALALEKAVEFDYAQKGIPLAERKSIIGDLSQELVRRLLSSSPEQLLKAWMIIRSDIEEKNIITWLRDQTMQNYISQEGWTGEVRQGEGDYLYFVDANLAALKTDSVVKREVGYSLSVDSNGDLIGRASITYSHTGKLVPDLISKYRTYVRIYVPADTWFTRAYLQDDGGITELGLTKEAAIGDELDKRYLGAFLTVEPGASKTLVVQYRLPESVKAMYQKGLYKLIVQKQPGTAGHKLVIDLRFDQPIVAYFTDNLPAKLAGKGLVVDTDLRIDRDITVRFWKEIRQ